MSQQPITPLLWINKDASNVHRKKHVAEVNAHVQKTNSKKRPPKTTSGPRNTQVLSQRLKRKDSSQSSPGRHSDSDQTDQADRRLSHASSSSSIDTSTPQFNLGAETNEQKPDALIFSSYLEEDVLRTSDLLVVTENDRADDTKLMESFKRMDGSLPPSLDASNPLPGFLAGLSSHDKMLVHTHLTYMPQMYFGFSHRSAYCPIRTASVVNMLKAPIGTMWVLLSLDMFLETARNSDARKAVILRRKAQAYQLMSQAISSQIQATDENQLLGPSSAAIAEMFCGDPAKALTHLNGIDAYIATKGGMEYVKQMALNISMPIFAVSAYRTILQDNLVTKEAFERAQRSFIHTLGSLITWNDWLHTTNLTDSHSKTQSPTQDEGFDGRYDMNERFMEFQEVRARAFLHHPLLRKFVGSDYICAKPGEKIDHFIILYNLNRALADHGADIKQAVRFIDAIVNDIEIGGSTKGSDSTLKISGALRLITYRHAKWYSNQPGEGIARAWEALDALEIMKLMSPDMQQMIRILLHELLLGHQFNVTHVKWIDTMENAITAEWYRRHPMFTQPNG